MNKILRNLILFIFLSLPSLVFSTHIVGGSLTYVYNGGSSYTITLKLFRDCSAGTASFPPTVTISVLGYNGEPFSPSKDITMSLGPVTPVPSNLPPCAQQPNPMPCTQQGIYTTTVNNLPPNPGGYHMYFQIVARNLSLTNINASGNNIGESFYAYIPGTSIVWNENFTFANGTTVDNGTTAWSTAAGATAPASASVNSNMFQTTGANNGSQTWTSQVINIASYAAGLNASINLSESGTLDPNDSILVFYRINGGPLIPFSTNGVIADDFANAIASQTGIVGSTVQFVIRVHYDASSPNSEIYNFDNVNLFQNDFQNNSNPTFTVYPPLFLCVNTPFTFDHSAIDINNDSLVYEFYTPYQGEAGAGPFDPTFANNTATFTPITFLPGYSTTAPLGGAPLTLNSSTGLLSGTPPTLGQFVVGILVKEYRNGVLLSSTLRDFQFNVVNCPQTLAVTIGPQNPTVCFGGNATTITANATGGTPPYTYLWNNVNPAQSISVGVGTYSVTVTDAAGCQVFAFVNVTAFPSAITANIGPDINRCNQIPVATLTGTVTAASGGIWSGGTGAYSPNTTTLSNMQYTPSAAEIIAGFAQLYLTTTGNGTCPADKDTVRINYAPFQGTVAPTTTPITCFGNTNGVATATVTGGNGPFTYLWNTSPTQNTASANNLGIGTYSVTITDATGCTSQTTATITQPAQLAVTTSVTTGGCAAGNITTTVSGGTAPYTYLWSPGGQTTSSLTSVPAGTYTVVVTDAKGCQKTVITTNTQPLPITASIVGTNTSCFGGNNGSATSTVSGGTTPYTYSWSGSGTTTSNITGLSAGNYTLTVTDNRSCSTTATVTISQPATFTVSTNVINETCSYSNNGTATASPSGGTGPYTYLWQGSNQTTISISNLASGTYTVITTDSKGCTATSFATITEPALLTNTFGSQTNVNCFGGANGSVSANGTGGTPGYTYNWMPGNSSGATANGLIAGTYSVTVTDSKGCVGQNTVTITQPTVALAVNSTITNTSCFGGINGSIAALPTGGTAPYTYSWSPGGQTTATATGLAVGNYTVNVTDAKGCIASTNATVNQPAAINVSINHTDVNCFNGTNGSVTTTVTGGTPTYTYLWSPGGANVPNINFFPAGTYTVNVKDVRNCSATGIVTITQPSTLTVNAVPTAETCDYLNNGSALSNVTGGTAPYTYSWLPGGQTTATATGLSSGSYTLIVTDTKGCTKSTTTNITQPLPISISYTNQLNVNCFGGSTGSVRGVASGGTPNYTYSWAPGGQTTSNINGLSAGTYSLTVTDTKGCQTQTSVTITEPATALAVNPSSTPALCFGSSSGSASAIGSGGTAPYTSYTWLPGNIIGQNVSNLAAGNYTVTIKDNLNCLATNTISVSQPSQIIPVLSTVGATCGNPNGEASAVVSGGTAPYTYQWFPSGGTASTTTPIGSGSYTVIVTDANNCTGSQSTNVNNTSGPTASIFAVTNVSCHGGNDGSASVGVVGGTGTLVYQWLPSGGNTPVATGLTAGIYTVSVTDANGCQSLATTSPPISEPAAISIGISTSEVGCFGAATGSAIGSATGGTGTLDYLWLPSNTVGSTISNQSAGTYTLQITDDNNCLQTQTFSITEPSAILSVAISATPALCFGSADGTTTASASGGTSPYSYSWMPGNISSQNLGGLIANTYTVNVTDINGCTTSNSISVTEPTALSLTTSNNSSTCGNSNGTASVNASGGTGTYSYFWVPDNQTTSIVTGLIAGTYSVLVTDANNCSATTNITISNIASPVVSITSATNVSCFGGSDATATTSVIGGTGTIDYLWTPSGGTSSVGTGLGTGTYTVTVTDDNGCQASAITNEITEPNLITINVSTTNVNCFGDNTGAATAAAAGGTPGYSYVWLPSNLTGQTIPSLNAGTFSVEVTDSKNCTQIQSFTITQPSAVLSVAMSSTSVSCFGGNNGSATATVAGGTSPYSYLWSPTGSAQATETNLTTGNYSVAISDFNGCTTTGSITVQQPAQALSATGTGGITSCFNGADGTAFVTPTGGTPSYNYQWTPSGGNAQTANNLTPGNYIINITDANNCTTSASITIGQPTLLTGSLSIVDASCGLPNGVINAQINGGTSPYSYAWSNGVNNNTSISNLNPATYSLQVTDNKNCVQTFSASIVNIPGPTVSTSASTPVSCFGGSNGSATISITQGTAPFTINWLPSGGNTTSANGLTAGTYTAVVTDNLGCINSAAIATITEPSLLNIGISNTTDVACNGGNNAAITVTAIGGTPNYIYSWSPITSSSPTVNNIGAGTYTVTVVDQNSCSTSISIPIIEPSQLSSTIASSVNPVCFNGLGSASVLASGGTIPYSYSWNTLPIQTGSSALDIPAGAYTATITDANGCVVSNAISITQPSQIITTAGPNTIVCLGNSTTLTVSATGGSGNYQYTWGALGIVNNGSLTFSPTTTETYTVTAYDQFNCAGISDTLTATVYDLNASSIDVVADTLICPGASTGVFTQINGNPGPITISWNNGLPNGPGAYVVTPFQPTTYIATVTNQCGALVKDSVRVKFNPQPTIHLIPDTNSICVPTSLQFTDASITGNVNDPITSWLWNFGDGTFSNVQNPSHQYNTPGSYNVSLTVATAGGCTNNNNSAPVTVVGYPIPTAAFSINSAVLNLPSDQLICTNQSSGANSYSWNFGDGLSSTLANPHHFYAVVGVFQIELISTNQFGCSDTATNTVTTDADVIFPNVFSPSTSGPNGGAYNLNNTDNNVFFPYTAGVSEYKMQIFNRWGELIFESNDINIGWDGYYRGVICPQDVYVWKAYLKLNNGKTFNKTGDVTLLQ